MTDNRKPGWMNEMFAALDAGGVPGLFPWLDEDVCFRFAGYPPGRGREQFAATWAGMSGHITSLHHELAQSWDLGDEAICRGEVTYGLDDGRQLSVPFVNVFKLRDGLISEYLVYVDASAVFGAAPG